MARYTIEDVKITGIFNIDKVLEITMNVSVNQHGTLTYGGIISHDVAKQYIQQNIERQPMNVHLRDEVEFSGYAKTIYADTQNDHCYIRVTLDTSSKLTDIDPCNRFFQDTNCSFADIITEAYEDSSTGSLAAVRGKEEINKPILQYRETDWQFTLRMAGILGTVVIPNVASVEPQVSLGVPKRQIFDESNNYQYSISRNAGRFRRYNADRDIEYQNFLCYKMRSDNRYKLGDSVKIDGKILTVMQKSFVYEQGEIQEYYILGHEQDFAVPLHQNNCITGLELEGKVLERSAQKMKIILDIDTNRKDGGKTWFSYAPVTNNGMYSMPLENEKVMLHWQSENDDDVLVIRPDRKNSHDTINPSERHFLTEHDNHLVMIPHKMAFTNPAGDIEWLTSRGLNLSSFSDVSISAQKDISIQAVGQVQVDSPERITASKLETEKISADTFTTSYATNSSIDMIGNELHIKSDKKVTTSSKANKYKKATLPERLPNITIAART